jgi:hypothetical protein
MKVHKDWRSSNGDLDLYLYITLLEFPEMGR